MASKKRTPIEIERDRRDIAAWYLRGLTQNEIADRINHDPERGYTLSQPMISLDLTAIKKRWQQSATRDFDDLRSQELAKVDELERTYWAAWLSSCGGDAVYAQKTYDEIAETNEDVKVVLLPRGEPKFLAGVQWCIERRCKLLGFDAPTKVAPTNPDGATPYAGNFIEIITHD